MHLTCTTGRVRLLDVIRAKLALALVDNVGAVGPVRLEGRALGNVQAVAHLQELVRMVYADCYFTLVWK